MASLLGRADSTLAQMSYREAMADVTPDLKDVYSAEALNQALFQTGVEGYFDKLYADNNALADELEKATKKAMTGLGTDYESMELFDSYLTSMKERMKALPKTKKGDFERAKIRAEMAQLLKSSTGLDDAITEVGTMIEAGEFNKYTTDYPVLLAIANGTAKKEIENGNLFYSIPNPKGGKDLKIDHQGVRDALGQSDLKFESSFNKIGAGENAKGKKAGTIFDRQGSINAYEESFPSEAAFAANIHKKQGSLPYSFVQALSGKDPKLANSIYEALTSMGGTTITKYDVTSPNGGGPDGKITAADFANQQNGVALIESLTDPRSDNFDYQIAKQVAAKFYADNIAKKEFDDGSKMRTKKVDKGDDKGGTGTGKYGGFLYGRNETGGDPNHPNEDKRQSYQNIGYLKQMTNRNTLLNFDPDDPSTSIIPGVHYDYQYNKKDGWQAFDNNEFIKNVKGSDIARFEGLLSADDIKKGNSYAMFNVGTRTFELSKEKKEKAPRIPGGIGLGAIESSSVNQVKVNLQNILSHQFATDFNVTPVYESSYSLEQKGEVRRIVKNKIKITGPGGFEKIYNIGPDATSEIADQITADLADYKRIVPSDLMVN